MQSIKIKTKNNVEIFKNGLATGLFFQLAIGPVFFFIINLALQRTIYDGLIAVLAVTIVDYCYITLAMLGIGKLIEKKNIKHAVGIVSSIVLIIFGIIIIKGITGSGITTNATNSMNLFLSFTSVFVLTLSSPMTIVFFTGIFAAKAVEYNYTKRELYIFGLAVGLATLIFMGTSVILFSLLGKAIPMILIQILNLIVGFGLIVYGGIRLVKVLKRKN